MATGDGAGLVTPGTATIVGTDFAGIVKVTTGTGAIASATVVRITFSSAYAVAPTAVLIVPANNNAGQTLNFLVLGQQAAIGVGTVSTTFFDIVSYIGSTAGLLDSTDYWWYYIVIG